MSEEQNESGPKYDKGTSMAIARGKANVGVRGTIFWSGANKYGSGFRYGLKDDSGATYWVDEADLGSPEDAPPAPPSAPQAKPPAGANGGGPKAPLEKGARVEITGGREGVGAEGEVFWTGDSKFGEGMRYGVKSDEGTTYWVDGAFVNELAGAPKGSGSKGSAKPSGSRRDDASAFRDDRDDFRDEFSDDLPSAQAIAGEVDVDPASMPEPPPMDDAPFDDSDFRDDAPLDDPDDLPF